MIRNAKKKSKRVLSIAAVIMVLCMAVGTTVFAANIGDFVWMQSTGRKVIDLGYMSPGSDINASGIRFHCVASSSANGNFEVVLQRKGLFGVWQNVGNRYTCGQTSERKYDPKYEDYVNGQPSLLNWATAESGEYRIILENATRPQSTTFTRVEAWAYWNH